MTTRGENRVPQRLLQEIEWTAGGLQSLGRNRQGQDNGGDVADQAYQAVESATDDALRAHQRQKRQQLERALERADAGLYGICERCGRVIDPARLRVLPYATSCMTCLERGEGKQRGPEAARGSGARRRAPPQQARSGR
jgi:DnaK suppressor protein